MGETDVRSRVRVRRAVLTFALAILFAYPTMSLSAGAADDGGPTPPGRESSTSEPATTEADTTEPEAAESDAIGAPADAQDSTIRVRKAGDRLGLSKDVGASGLAGATFAAYRKGTSTTQNIPSGAPEATCTTDASGTCDLLVDSDSRRYLVVEESAPPGWSVIDEIALGDFDASGTDRPYRWNVEVSAGSIALVPTTEIVDRSDQTWRERPNPSGDLGDDDYRWANVRDNPLPPVDKCGLDIALLFDQSGSIGNNLDEVQGAATDFVDQLTGTPTQIAIFTFSTNSPKDTGGSQNRPDLVPITEQAGADQVKGYINGLSSAGGGTNWDHGLREMAAAAPDYDIALVLTDGNPTAWRGENSSTGEVNDYDVEEAVHSANWLKQLGTRVIAIGFSGQQGGLTATNLALISGPVEGNPDEPELTDDFFLTTFGDLADLLTDIALANCGGTINVSKKISPTWNDIDSVDLEPDWPFQRDPAQTYVQPPSGVTGPQGQPLEFRVIFEQREIQRGVTITEPTLGPNLPIPDPDSGKNARCTISGETDPDSRIANVDNGVTIEDVTYQEIVSCLFVNSPLRLEARKYEDSNASGDLDPGEPFLPGWTLFLDDNGNSQLDPGETSGVTDGSGTVVFDRLAAEGDYRVCEVLQDGWFNTDPGGNANCKIETVEFPTASVDPVPPSGPVLFGNVAGGGFTVTKAVDDPSGLVPVDTEFTIEVSCTFGDQPVPGFDPLILSLTDGESAAVGPLVNGTICTIVETDQQGSADVTISQPAVTIPADDGTEVIVTNAYTTGRAEIAKITDGPLAELAPAGTQFTIEVTCTYPTGFPVQGTVPGLDPKTLVIEAGPPGQPGTPVDFGQELPVGTRCTLVEADDRGATDVTFDPDDELVITDSAEPVTVTITNTFEEAVLRILKEVEGATLPPDTRFTAGVVCTFGGETVFDDEVEFGVGPTNAGLVSGLPVGSTCTITETDDLGASSVTYDPGQTVELVGVSPVSVDITVTNTFEAGELSVVKVVDDGASGLVPDGTVFTINVTCAFGGAPLPGFPQDVSLTSPDQLGATFSGLPVGAECEVVETDAAGADSTVITPAQPVTITPSAQGPVEVTVTNVFETDAFEATKVVDDPAGLVPGTTEYTIEVTCTYPDGYQATGPIPGFDPLQLILTPGQTVSTGQLPQGAECSIAETGTGGAGAVEITPDLVVVGDGAGPVTVTVTNAYPVGALDLRKAVDDGGTGLIPIGSEYLLRVTCSYPAGYPVQGPIPGFDPLDVIVRSGVLGGPGFPVRVGEGGLPAGNGGLPVGAECTVTEPDPRGAATVDIAPDQPVTIIADLEDPVEVVVTNTYPVGTGEVVKVADGVLAPQYAPPGTQFLVTLTCTYPDDFPVSGSVPGYDSALLVIEAGVLGLPGTPTPFGPLPIGSECSIIEVDDGGATTVDISPDQPFIIDSELTPVTVTVTNTFEFAGVQILKLVDGPGGAPVPPDLVYTARLTCVFAGPSGPEVVFDEVVDYGPGDTTVVPGPGAATGLPVGSVCTVTEIETQGADATVDPSGEFVLEGEDPVSVEVTITNSFAEGALTLEKVIAGGATALVPDGTQYSILVSCELGGSRLVGFPTEVVLTTPDQLSTTITGLPVGSECFASETDTNGALSPPSFDPPGTEDFQSGIVTIAEDPSEPITITVTNTYPGAGGEVVKVVDGPLADLVPEGTEFDVEVTCQLPPGYPGAPGPVPGFDPLQLTIEAGAPGQPGQPVPFGPVPPNSSCQVVETDDGGASTVVISPPQPVIIDDEQTPVEITVTNTFEAGDLTVVKVVDGPAGPFVPDGTTYAVSVVCTFEGQTILDQELPFGVGDPAVITDLPIGSECTITETDAQGATDVVVTPSEPVTITGGESPVEVTVTNTYETGDLTVIKSLIGPGGSLLPDGTTFTVEIDCTFLGAPVAGFDPATVDLIVPDQLTQTVGPLPDGAECTLTETGSQGAQQVQIDPNPVTITEVEGPVQVTVTNAFDTGQLTVEKVLSGSGAAFVPDGTVFTIDVDCTFDGIPIPGFDPITIDLTWPTSPTDTIGPLPLGSRCTLTETNSQGARQVQIDPNPITISSSETPVDVTVTNTYPGGTFEIEKVVDGALASLIPAGTEFSVVVDCALPDGFPGAPGPIPGYPTTVTILSGPPGTPGAPSSVGPLPVGAQCSITELETNGATSTVVAPETVTVTEGASSEVEVTVTNTYRAAALVIRKGLDGPGADLVPPGTVFTADVVCVPPEGSGAPGFDGQVEFGVDDPAIVAGQPVGSECTVTETDSQGASSVSYAPSQTVTLEGQPPVSVAVTVTNTFEVGEIAIEKVLEGQGAQFVPDRTRFVVEVTCRLDGRLVPGYPTSVRLTPQDPTARVSNMPLGSTCAMAETQNQGAQRVRITPNPVTVTDAQPSVEVTATNTFRAKRLRVTKSVVGPAAGSLPDGTTFTVSVTCSFLGSPVEGFDPRLVELSTPDQLARTVGPLPVGARCRATETTTSGAQRVTITPSGPFTITDSRPGPIQVTVANRYDNGALIIEKRVTGPGAGLARQPFQFEVRCTFRGAALPTRRATITPPSASARLTQIPVGARCSVGELPPYGGADGPATVTPNTVTIGSGDPVVVTATNVFPLTPLIPKTGSNGILEYLTIATILLATGVALLRGSRRRSTPRRT